MSSQLVSVLVSGMLRAAQIADRQIDTLNPKGVANAIREEIKRVKKEHG